MSDALRVVEADGVVRFSVRVVPRAKRSSIEGILGESLKVRLSAPPVDGAANAALVEVLAEALGIAQSRVLIVRGVTSRSKTVEVRGLATAALRAKIELLVSGGA